MLYFQYFGKDDNNLRNYSLFLLYFITLSRGLGQNCWQCCIVSRIDILNYRFEIILHCGCSQRSNQVFVSSPSNFLIWSFVVAVPRSKLFPFHCIHTLLALHPFLLIAISQPIVIRTHCIRYQRLCYLLLQCATALSDPYV